MHKKNNELKFLPNRIKIGKVEKLVINFKDKKDVCNIHQRFKQNIEQWVETEKKVN